MRVQLNDSKMRAIWDAARELGVDAIDLATAIGYETIGKFSGKIRGGKNNKYIGAIQFGPWEQKRYGVTPEMAFEDQVRGPVVEYFRDRGLKPGMGLMDIYSTINAGSPGLYNRSDRPGYTVSKHVKEMEKSWKPRIEQAFQEFDARNGAMQDFVRQTEADASLGNIMAGQPGIPQGPGVLSMYQALNDMNVMAAPTPVAKRDNPANPQFADNAVGNLRGKDYGYQTARSVADLMGSLGGPVPPTITATATGQQFDNPVQVGSASVNFGGEPERRFSDRYNNSINSFPADVAQGPIPSSAQNIIAALERGMIGSPMEGAIKGIYKQKDDGLSLFDPIGPETTPELSYGPSQRLGPRAAPDLPELSYGPSQRLGPRGSGLPGTLPQVPGVQFMDDLPQGMPTAPMQAPVQAPVAPPAPQLPPLAPPQFISPRQVSQPQPPSLDLVPNAAQSVASTVAGHGLMGDAGPGFSYGYSPWGSGVARIHDSAPEQVKIAASGPGLFGAVKKDFGVDLTPGPGKMGAPLASAAALGLAALGAGPFAAIPIAANMMGGSRFGVNRMDVVPQQSGGGLLGNLFGGLFGGGNRAQPQQQQSRSRNEVSFHGPIGRNVSERSGNLSEASRAEVERATRGLY